MNRKIFALFALTAGMHLAVHASENVNTTENRQFLKQQENLSRQLREKPDHQLKAPGGETGAGKPPSAFR